MYRLLALSTVVVACLAAQAEAIEMFTNFHNGENVGFPPMQVPIGVYGGWGRGGWNPNAEGMPLKTWPPVPSMTPTGQIPGGFRRFNSGACNGDSDKSGASNGNAYNGPVNSEVYGAAAYDAGAYEARPSGGADGVAVSADANVASGEVVNRNISSRNNFGQVLMSDRRRNGRWQRGNDGNAAKDGAAAADNDISSDGVKKTAIAQPKNEPTLAPVHPAVILHAEEGTPPVE